jgi:hypothetical protein
MSPFRRILVLAGVPLGAAVAGETAFRSPASWWDLFLTGLGASVVIGGALASVAHLFIRRVRRSAWTVLLFLVAIALSGLFAGLGAYAAASVIPHGRWTRIPSPPGFWDRPAIGWAPRVPFTRAPPPGDCMRFG